jgi:hypothetical protein
VLQHLDILELGNDQNVVVSMLHVSRPRREVAKVSAMPRTEAAYTTWNVATSIGQLPGLLWRGDMWPVDAHDTPIQEMQDGGRRDEGVVPTV